MNLKILTVLVLLSSILFYVSMLGITQILMIEHEITSTADYIVDGETFKISAGYSIKLADINCPEQYEIGYEDAKYYLSNMIYGKTVYLDVDDIYRWDMGGSGDRLVCIVYVEFNQSHVLNVNEAMLESGNAIVEDAPNSFSPLEWRLFTPSLTVIEYRNLRFYSGVSSIILTVLLYLVFLGVSGIFRKKWGHFYKKNEPES